MTWPQDCQGQFVGTNFQVLIQFFFRLKGLAQGLNSELNEHNDLLDRWTMIRFKERNIGLISIPLKSERYQCPPVSFLRVNDKSEGVGFKVEKQNKAMEKILKK